MPPRDIFVSKEDIRQFSVRQLANPFSEAKRGHIEDFSERSENFVRRNADEGAEELEEELEQPVRVTTRARLNYELFKYSKNAMLIVTTEREQAVWERLVTDLKRTFQSFRFEVEIATVPYDGLYAKCEQFFQRDFSDYGAAALAILTTMAVNAPPNPEYDDGFLFFTESRIVENLRLDRNPTLVDKPKIYFTEAYRRSPGRPYHDLPYLDPATYGDVLGFHVPIAFPEDLYGKNLLGDYDENPRPLKLLCDKMAAACDNISVPTIMEEMVKETKKRFALLNAFPIEVVNNLSKSLYFARTENQ